MVGIGLDDSKLLADQRFLRVIIRDREVVSKALEFASLSLRTSVCRASSRTSRTLS